MDSLVHVDVVALHKALDHPRGKAAPLCAGQASSQTGHGLFGHEVLRQDCQLIRHRGSLVSHGDLL